MPRFPDRCALHVQRRALVLALLLCGQAAMAQNDHRPQWQDARPPAPSAAPPERIYTPAPKTLPNIPEAARTPAMADEYTGLALRGFDPVSYFTDRKPVTGRTEYETVIKGETWRFAQAANLKIFLDEPAAYRPQFGGFDAESVAHGAIADADPQYFLVLDKALYLFRTAAGRDAFAADAQMRTNAHAHWKTLANDTYR